MLIDISKLLIGVKSMNRLLDVYWKYKVVCANCKSVLLVETEDILVKFEKNLSIHYTFFCPCCNIESEIFSDFIPVNVKLNALIKFKKGIITNERFNV